MRGQQKSLLDEILSEPCKHNHNFNLPWLTERFRYICARDLGIFGGLVIFIPTFLILQKNFLLARNGLVISKLIIASFLLTLPLTVDWWLQCKGIVHSNNWKRFLTGLGTSIGISLMLIHPIFFWITLPLLGFWGWLINRIGHSFVKNRTPDWGCNHCKRI